jgi:hypothetical protein
MTKTYYNQKHENFALRKSLHFEEDQKYEKVRQRPQAFCNSLI